MQVFGNIATAVEKQTSRAGKDYFVFRLAENQGRDENRTTTWYDVRAFISELDADLLSKGQFVKVTGRLDVQGYLKRDGTAAAAAVILAASIEPVERKTPRPESGESTGQGHAQGAGSRSSHHGMDDDDDSIPY